MKPTRYVRTAPDRLDATFAALADPTRRAILRRLATGDASVTELAKPFAMSQPAISKHLKVLEKAGLITRGRDAQRRPCRIEAKPLAEIRPDLPPGLCAIIHKMMAKDPAERYQTPIEVVAALEPWTQVPIPPPTAEEMPRLSPAVAKSSSPNTTLAFRHMLLLPRSALARPPGS